MKSGDVISRRYHIVLGPEEDRGLQGGMGRVYLCVDMADDGRPVALKTFHPHYLSDRLVRDRFLREADVWIRLGAHPHIVRARRVERSVDGTEVYVVADWVAPAEGKRGASLREHLHAGRPIAPAIALRWTLGIVRGLAHATTVVPGLVHKDLKPENVLVGRDGHARVTDFGLAQVLAGATANVATRMTRAAPDLAADRQLSHVTATWAGTPPYMAPEQWDGGVLDLRADIYAVGCIVAELLTGLPPVRGATWEACRSAHRAGAAEAAISRVPEALRPWLERCVAPNPAQRYATWAAVARGLEALYPILTGEAVPPAVSTLAASEQETRESRIATAWALAAIGAAFSDIGKLEEAARYFEKVRRAGADLRDRLLEGWGLGGLGRFHQQIGRLDRSLDCCERALAIARELGEISFEAGVLNQLGTIYRDLQATTNNNDFARRAVELHEQAVTVARGIGDRQLECAVLQSLGGTWLKLGNEHQARACYESCLGIARELGFRGWEANAMAGLGSVLEALGDFPAMITAYEEYLATARSIGDRVGEGIALGNLGNAHRRLGDTAKAIGCYREDLAISREVGDRAGEAASALNLAHLYVQQQEGRASWSYAEAAAALFGDLGRTHEANQAQELLHALCLVEDEDGKPIVRGTGEDLARAKSLYTADREPEALEILEWMLQLSESDPASNSRFVEALARGNLRSRFAVPPLSVVRTAMNLRSECFAAIMSPRNPVYDQLLSRAQQHLDLVDHLYPDDPSFLAMSAQILFLRGDVKEALDMIDRAVTLAPGDRQAASTREIFRSKAGASKLTDIGVDILMRASQGEPGQAGDARESLERATKYLQASLDLDEQQPAAWAGMAWVLASVGQAAQAVKVLQQARRMDPRNDLVQQLIAEFRRRGWWKDA